MTARRRENIVSMKVVRNSNLGAHHRPSVRDPNSRLKFLLKPVTPFRLDLTAWTLRRRTSNLIDRWNGRMYRRVLVLENAPVEVAVSQFGGADSASLRVTLTGRHLGPETKRLATLALERLLGLRIDLSQFHKMASADAKLDPLAERFRGVKPPRFLTLFEALVNAIACQQMSLSLGIVLLSRLSVKFGMVMESVDGMVHAFPRPEEMVNLEPKAFRELGFSLQKGRAIIASARACSEGGCSLEELESLDNQAVVERLLGLRGIGRWSAEYVLLRGLGRLNVYPGDDVGARNNLKRWLNLRKTLDYTSVRRITARWQPYAGLVYFHMLLDRLAATGDLAREIKFEQQDALC